MKLASHLIKTEDHIVPTLENRIRLSDYVPGIFKTIHSNKGIKKAIKNGWVTINGTIGFTSDYLKGGELIVLYRSTKPSNKPTIHIPLEIVYEDEYLAIINKPSGILVSGNKKYTLENALPCVLKKSNEKDGLLRPEPVHRLDYPTSGALLIGKNSTTLILLNKMFEERMIQKKYFAVTIGHQKDSGIITSQIENKPSKSEFKVISKLASRKYNSLNLVELIPHTGRRHQLRKHLASLGNPILGDILYGKEGIIGKGNGLYLHASQLRFKHPITENEVSVEIPLPKKFHKLFPQE